MIAFLFLIDGHVYLDTRTSDWRLAKFSSDIEVEKKRNGAILLIQWTIQNKKLFKSLLAFISLLKCLTEMINLTTFGDCGVKQQIHSVVQWLKKKKKKKNTRSR